jgi:rubrerythrin
MALLTGEEVIEIAMRLEESGEAFYSSAAEEATTASVQNLFHELALQERYHRRAFQMLGGAAVELTLSPEQWDRFQAYTDALLQQSFFRKPEGALRHATVAQNEREALQSALGFEQETLVFFQQLRDALRQPGQKVVDDIIQEEKRHIQRLSAAIAEL